MENGIFLELWTQISGQCSRDLTFLAPGGLWCLEIWTQPLLWFIKRPKIRKKASLMAFWVKNLPGKQETLETQVWSLGWEETLEKEMATHSSIPAWKISWTEEFGGLQSKGWQRVGNEWVTTHTVRKTKSKADFVKPGLWNTDKNGRKHMEHRQKWKWQVKDGENKGHRSHWRGPFIWTGGTMGGCSYLETVKQGLRYKW